MSRGYGRLQIRLLELFEKSERYTITELTKLAFYHNDDDWSMWDAETRSVRRALTRLIKEGAVYRLGKNHGRWNGVGLARDNTSPAYGGRQHDWHKIAAEERQRQLKVLRDVMANADGLPADQRGSVGDKPTLRRSHRSKPLGEVSDTKERDMDAIRRKELETIALERMHATAHDEERWSFTFRTNGAVGFFYCPWFVTENWEFDGLTDNLDLPWAPERLQLIKRGEADPNEEELCQWRQAKCWALTTDAEWAWVAWAVPMNVKGEIVGYALFSSVPNRDPDDAPSLDGVFDSLEDLRAALRATGPISHEG